MIKKSIDKITATEKQKKDIYERICADYEKSEKTEKKTKNNFLKYGAMAAATVLALGAVAAVVSIIINMQGVPVTHPESISGTASSHIHSEDKPCDCIPSDIPPHNKYADIEVDTKPILVTWFDIDENTPQMELFKNLYGIPENKPAGYEDTPDDNVFAIMKVNYSDRYYELTKLVSSGKSPDIMPFELSMYPYTIINEHFESIDELFDFSYEEWELHNELSDQLMWKGKTYVPVISVNPYQVLWYRKSVVEDYGLADPFTLYREGKWDWTAFFDMSEQFVKNGENVYAIDGYGTYIGDAFALSTGKSFFSLNNGVYTSNLYDADLENAMDILMKKLNNKENQLRYPSDIVSNYNPNRRSWTNGNTLFFADGYYRYEEDWQKYMDMFDWDEDEIQFVPFPKADGKETYYQQIDINSYMLCKGSSNQNAYKAWICANLLVENDIDARYYIDNKKIAEYKWTWELLDRVREVNDTDNIKPVISVKGTIQKATSPDVGFYDPVIENLTKKPFFGTSSFTAVRDENSDFIKLWVDKINE
ncbi:MAG: carbohydrate ABC transporter substrate-binding protein [Ruminococcaceae bacterium]|nr:carbohydrate ABC transporter substrate-binding protein [Oscillospiraceae bacterium]